MEEIFRSGTLDMSADPLPAAAAGVLWSDLPGNRILCVAAIVVLLLELPDLLRLVPHLTYAFSRSRGAAELEHGLGIARTRNTVALCLLLPFCLILDRFAPARPAFTAGLPAAWGPAEALGTVVAYLLLRRCCYLVFSPRRLPSETLLALRHNPYSYFIPLTALMLLSCWILSLFSVPDQAVRDLLRWEIALFFVPLLFRSGQILNAHCSGFATIMYLCGLEIIPAAVLVAVVSFF